MKVWHADQCAVFMRTREEWGIFSNFAPSPMQFKGTWYHTAEHFYQCFKFPHDKHTRTQILSDKWPGHAARVGRLSPGIREDWEDVKLNAMRFVLHKKFVQCEQFSKEMWRSYEEGKTWIVEKSYRDQYWGAKPSNPGLLYGHNHLGLLLTALRNASIGNTETAEELFNSWVD